MGIGLTAFDKKLLNELQENLPLTPRPFADLAKKLGSSEEKVLTRLRELKAAGYLRRIGTFFDSNRLGYTGTLAALKADPEHLPQVAEAVNRFPGVTHNYEREGEYNLWFTLLSPGAEAEAEVLAIIKKLPGVEKLISLKARRKYKINVKFDLR